VLFVFMCVCVCIYIYIYICFLSLFLPSVRPSVRPSFLTRPGPDIPAAHCPRRRFDDAFGCRLNPGEGMTEGMKEGRKEGIPSCLLLVKSC
jgi:hypothetical protein